MLVGREPEASRVESLVSGAREGRREARVHLRIALTGFERLDAAPWVHRAANELRATGESTRRRNPSTLTALTPQELQIATLVGDGGSNKDIAAQLLRGPRTVGYHLHKVVTKLGISTRAELMKHGVAAAVPART